ncbi:hypothetical protein SAMN05216267_102536 [Actinacidiphila rubida]|uniref:Cellulose synthase n=1 Tax=Actinacidiphila rubida TaxID=310780 RepID=A0A1H8PBK1_9ACTN|nr:hypothetical protein [Actinacidiphila rubida]SEO39369.1 hypothetical protein SAMN05216267_102536 [Actinacidiphila rubida]
MLTTALCAALSVAGLALAVRTAYRRRYLRATRIAAVSLLPVGLAMAGLVTLGRRIGTAVADWAADLVLRPTVWIGFGVIACSVLLYGATRLISGSGRGEEAAAGGSGRAAVPAGGPGPAAAAAPALPQGRGGRRGSGDGGLSEFADVEEILKRRGI